MTITISSAFCVLVVSLFMFYMVYIKLNTEKLMLRSQFSGQPGPGTMQQWLGFKLAVLPVYLRKTCMSTDRTK